MANEPRKPQIVPLAKIHDLPGVFIPKVQDKAYGGLVTSIQVSGVKEAVILRLREDGEYQLVDGYRRRRASELAKKKDIPALVYKMTLQEAIEYHKKVKGQPTLPVPGVLVNPPTETQEPLKGDKAPETEKKPEQTVPTASGKKADEPAPKAEQPAPKEGKTPEAEKKPEQATPAVPGKKADEPAPKAEQTAPKEGKSLEGEKKPEQVVPAAPGKKADEPAPKAEQAIPKEGKAPEEKKPEQAVPAAPGKKADEPAPKAEQATPKEGKTPEAEKKPEQTIPAAPGKKADEPAPKADQTAHKEVKSPEAEKKPEQTIPAAPSKKADEPAPKAEQTAPKEGKTLEGEKKPETVVKAVGMAAKGPAGTQITQVFEDRLSPPDDKELKNLPTPKEGESYFIVLHPGYLEKSKFNTVSVDQNSEDYRELKKSIELNGVKDPVLTRINPDGGLEILSGQRRHMIARELNYPVPAIIQKIDDADAKILVSDGNLHRPKISTYDLSRTLRMKMEGMKQKAGRRKKGFTAEELNSDEKLAKEMGMSVSIDELNYLAKRLECLSPEDLKKFAAAVRHGEYVCSVQDLINLAYPCNLEQFMWLPEVKTYEDYGRYLVDTKRDFSLPRGARFYFNYEEYGETTAINENGDLTPQGYICHVRSRSFQEIYDGKEIPREYRVFQYPLQAKVKRRNNPKERDSPKSKRR